MVYNYMCMTGTYIMLRDSISIVNGRVRVRVTVNNGKAHDDMIHWHYSSNKGCLKRGKTFRLKHLVTCQRYM